MFGSEWRQWLRRTFGLFSRNKGHKAGAARSPARCRPRLEELECRLTPAVTISATKVVDLATANPGDTLNYSVAISNTGSTDATSVQYLDTVDSNTTFVSNSVKVSPMAVSHSYSSAGNTPLSVAAGSGLLAGVHDIDGVTADNALVLTTGTFSTSQGGSVVINADGSFTYTPQTGDQNLTDTFTYTVTDTDNLASTGTVSVAVGERVWYVDSSASAAGADGSFNHPFTSLTPLNNSASDVDDANDTIFVYNRGTAYTTGITLEANQNLYGDGFALTVNGLNIGASASNTSLTTTGITLASGNTVKGFDISGTSAVAISGTGVAGGRLT